MVSGTVVIAGASGFIGTELVRRLREDGRNVVRLVRRAPRESDERMWDPEAGWIRPDVLEDADAVVNLAGATIARLPWTLQYKKTILRSRVQSTTTLARGIADTSSPPAVFVSASASGYYGDRPGEILTEDAGPGEGFLPKVCQAWESAAQPAANVTRVVTVRTGLVLGRGGVLGTLRSLARIGVAGRIGTGGQHWPWLSLDDEVGAIVHCLNAEVSGAVNLCAPRSATADEVFAAVARTLHRPYWLPEPSWAIRLALADAGKELLLADQAMSSTKLDASGYEFRDTDVDAAVERSLQSA